MTRSASYPRRNYRTIRHTRRPRSDGDEGGGRLRRSNQNYQDTTLCLKNKFNTKLAQFPATSSEFEVLLAHLSCSCSMTIGVMVIPEEGSDLITPGDLSRMRRLGFDLRVGGGGGGVDGSVAGRDDLS